MAAAPQSQTQSQGQSQGQKPAKDGDWSFLMDKDSQDVHQELSKLKIKFQETRDTISSMPGIDVSPEQQQQQLQNLQDQVRIKKELLQKYKSLCIFDIPKQ
uniref:Mediator of RNA polymerase II transcription subunit 9 n=1 Tax=Callorhinchus milii TaxID=7868 RepID=A0A4W3JD03_CALMI